MASREYVMKNFLSAKAGSKEGPNICNMMQAMDRRNTRNRFKGGQIANFGVFRSRTKCMSERRET